MRAKGVQPVADSRSTATNTAKKRPLRAIVVGGVAVALAAAAWLARPRGAEDVPSHGLVPLDPGALQSALSAEQVSAGGLERLLQADGAIEKLAQQSSRGKQGAFALADAVYAALRGRASAMAFIPWSLGEPRGTPVMTAAQTLAKLQKDNARAELYPLELSAVMVAALRAQDVPAMVAELTQVKGRTAPLDPSGYLGYFAVAVYPEQAGVGTPRIYDVYGGQSLGPDAQFTVLPDTAAVGAALALRALHENNYLADPRKALESSSHALQLAKTLPSVRTVRGVVVLTEKMLEQGLQEFQAARELRGDAPRQHNLASVMLVTGDVEKAQSVLSAALERSPDFASARATLATLMLLRGETEQALAELQKAERLAPNLTPVIWAFADYHMRRQEPEEALARARRAYALRPSFDAKLRLAALLRHAGKLEEMRTLAAQLLAAVPDYRKSDTRMLINAVLGPTAVEPEQPTQVDMQADDLSDLGAPDLKLNLPDSTLRSGAQGQPADGDDAPRLRLRSPNQGLRLQLGGK